MAYKRKGPSLYPNYGKGGKIKINRESTATKDGRATSSPLQQKATSTNFADGTKKSKRDKFNDEENRREELLNQGFTQADADAMIDSGATTGRVTPKKGDYKKYSDLEKYDDDRPVNTKKKTKK